MRSWINIVTEAHQPSFESFKASLIQPDGTLHLYRIMNMDGQNPVEMIADGHPYLGCCWSYDLDFLRHGGHDFGHGGEPEDWFYFEITVAASAVDWDLTEEFYVELNNFEREIRLLGDQPIRLLGISDHFGHELDCSAILQAHLTSGPKYAH